jgi:hypothetical protein
MEGHFTIFMVFVQLSAQLLNRFEKAVDVNRQTVMLLEELLVHHLEVGLEVAAHLGELRDFAEPHELELRYALGGVRVLLARARHENKLE